MKTLIAILVAMLSATLCATAQREDNVWIYAGNRIDFNTEPPTVTPMNTDYHTECNITSVADADGNLVYWLNGTSLYNSNNEVVYSLPDASGSTYFYGLSIVPFPYRDKEYLFVYPDAANGKMVVSLADGSKDLLHPEITERYAEFPYYEPHYMGGAADGVPMFFQKFGSRDYWLLYAYQGKIKVYALTKDGFSYTGKSYNLPTSQEMGYDSEYFLSGHEMSPDRSKIFINTSPWWYYTIFIDLDTKTGDIKVINHFRVYVMEAYAFSSGNKYMYFAYERLLYRISVENLARCTSDEDFMAYREVVGLLHCDFGDMKFLTSGGLYFLNNDSGEYIGAVLDCDSEHPVINNQWLKLARNVHDYGDGRSIAFPKTYCYPYGFTVEESCGEVKFTFTDDSSYESLSWDFGDGSTSTEVSPVHKYKANGKYNVTLTVNYPTGDRPVLTVKKDLLVTSLMRKLVIVEE